tara:strand:+ start:4487 stop:8686 length:4200 start_codon:yes stop_codon:yes gene_type:complete
MSRHTKVITRSFAGGEMSPEMFGRMDDVKFQAGAATLLNCIPRPAGATARRSGTRLVRETRDATKVAHLLPFVFSSTQSMAIECSRATVDSLEGGYFRFHTNGGTLLYSQPDRWSAAQVTKMQPGVRSVSCTKANPMVVTLEDHGLSTDDPVRFISANPPAPFTWAHGDYYVNKLSDDTFSVKATKAGSAIESTTTGYDVVLFNWQKWGPKPQDWLSDEHGFNHKDPVFLTMWPGGHGTDRLNYVTKFSGNRFQMPNAQLLNPVTMGQQVMFVPDSVRWGALPPGIDEGRLYYTTSYTAEGWTVSKTFGGPALDFGEIPSLIGWIRVGIMPLTTSPGVTGPFSCLTKYYVVATANSNLFRLESSLDRADSTGAGLYFAQTSTWWTDFKVHRAYESGDLVSHFETVGSDLLLRNYYSNRSTWRDSLGGLLVTEEMHTQAASRAPAARSSLMQGDYWRELPGHSTGGVLPVTTSGTVPLLVTAAVGHGFASGQAISFVRGTPPYGFSGVSSSPDIYFVSKVNTTTFNLAATAAHAVAGTPLLSAGTALTAGNVGMQAWVTFDASTDRVGWPSHGLGNGDTVIFSAAPGTTATASAIQGGLTLGTTYYVREKTTDDFRVSATATGALIDLKDTDGAYITASGDTIYEVPHNYSEEELPRITTTQSNDVLTLASRDHPVAELRRVSSTRWELAEPEFVAAAPVPGDPYEVEITPGEGMRIVGTATVATGPYAGWHLFRTHTQHNFTEGNPVYVEGLPSSGLGSLADGYYLVGTGDKDRDPREYGVWNVFLVEVDGGAIVSHGGDVASGLDGRIRYGTQGEDQTQTYVVTSIDTNNEESPASAPLAVSNNLFVSGASNSIGWGASSGAIRYRVYKELSGLFGLIGETDDLTFLDDNIGPDLAVSPPLPDSALRKESRVTFDAATDLISWTAHGLSAGAPVVFRASDQMPGVNEGQTYFVMNPETDGFQVTDDLETEAIVDITGTDTGLHTAVSGNFPSAVSYFEGRRVFAGSRALPQDIWMTASGTESDLSYSIPTVDSDRIYFRIASREMSAVRHLVPLSQLVLLSDSTEYRLTPANDDILTPSSISVRPQSFIGTDYPHPALVNNTVVFAAARGGHVRELGYNRDVLGYLTGDLSLRAAHLFDGFTIKDQAYAKAPLPIVWCVSSSGKLLGITYIPEEQVGAWHQHTTPADGEFESVVSIPEGDEDAVYVVVKRTINSVVKRFVERFASEYRGGTSSLPDAYFVDCGLTYSGASTTSIAGLDHLEGEAVSYLADGLVGTGTVTSGTLTLTKAATKVHVGLGYTSQIQTLPLTMMRVDAFGTGRSKNINQVWARVFESGAFKAGPTSTNLRASLTPSAGSLLTDLVQVTLPASWDDDGQIVIQQETPLPLTVVGLTIEVASGG